MNEQASLDIQAGQLWGETLAWLSSHSLQIMLGFAAGAVIVVAAARPQMAGRAAVRHRSGSCPLAHRARPRPRRHPLVVHGRGSPRGWWPAMPARPSMVATTIQVDLRHRRDAAGRLVGARDRPRRDRAPRRRRSRRASSLGSAIGIIRLLVTIAIFTIALVVMLDNLGVNVTGLVAGLGIGGIAIGLAAQGIFADLFAALADHLRQALPARRFGPLGHDLGHGREYRPQVDAGPLDHRRGGGDLQHQPAQQGAAQHGAAQPAADHPAVRPRLPDLARGLRPHRRDRRGGRCRPATNACSCAAA